MALVKCEECGNNVSDKASSCIHCGSPIFNSNNSGNIKIKCKYLNGAIFKAKVVNSSTGEELASIPQNGVVSFKIDKNINVDISYPMYKSTSGTLKFEGSHFYEISATTGFLLAKLVFNEVSNIDSGD